MLSAHNGELISKNLFIDRADRINSSGGGRFIIIIISYVQSIGSMAQTHCSNRPENLFTSRLRRGNLTLIFLIAAHSNHFSSCSVNFSHAARFSETISRCAGVCFCYFLSLSLKWSGTFL
jgi:hypothetical protein